MASATALGRTEDLDQLVASVASGLKGYLRTFGGGEGAASCRRQRTRSNWFCKPELDVVYNLLQINDTLGDGSKFLSPKTAWKSAMALAALIQLGSEQQLHLPRRHGDLGSHSHARTYSTVYCTPNSSRCKGLTCYSCI